MAARAQDVSDDRHHRADCPDWRPRVVRSVHRGRRNRRPVGALHHSAEARHRSVDGRTAGQVLCAARLETLMYKRILVAIEHSNADRTIIEHVSRLAELTGATLLLVHVADGWAA